MAENGQRGVRVTIVTVPDPLQIRVFVGRRVTIKELRLALQVLRLQFGVLAPGTDDRCIAPLPRRQGEQARFARLELAGLVLKIRVGQEKHPEAILDHVKRHLATTDRAFDEIHDRELRLVEHELIARRGRQRAESQEGIGSLLQFVRGKLVHRVIGLEEQLPPAHHALEPERVGQMRLVDNGFSFTIKPVVHALDAGVVIRPSTGNEVDGLPRRRPGAHQTEVVMRRIVVEVEVRQEKVFVDVAAGQALLERVAIQEGFPVGDLLLDSCRHRWQPFERRPQLQPASQGGHLGRVQARQTEGHSPQGVLALELRVLIKSWALLHAVEREIEGFRQDCSLRQRMLLLELQRAIHHARRKIRHRGLLALVEHRRESPGAPLRGGLRVGEQP